MGKEIKSVEFGFNTSNLKNTKAIGELEKIRIKSRNGCRTLRDSWRGISANKFDIVRSEFENVYAAAVVELTKLNEDANEALKLMTENDNKLSKNME